MKKNKIVFFIPGRIRINIPALLNDEKIAYNITGILDESCGVISVQSNSHTGNVLVRYDPKLTNENDILYKIEEETMDCITNPDKLDEISNIKLNPYSFITKKFPQTIFQNETHLSRRLIKTVLLTGGIVFAFKFMFRRLISILIFACPIIIFTGPITTFYFGVKRAKNRRIVLKDLTTIERLEKTQSVFINDSIFMLGMNSYENNEFNYQNVNFLEMRRLLKINRLDDLLNLKITNFVFGIRNNGITDIAIVNNQNNELVNSIAELLGIEKIYRIKDNITMIEFFKEHTMIVTSGEMSGETSKLQKGLFLYVYNKDCLDSNKLDINVHCRDIYKIPWLIGLSRYCREIIIRSQNSAIAIHSVGILLAALGYIGPFGAVSIYGMNMVGQHLYIKNKVLSYEKEIESDIK